MSGEVGSAKKAGLFRALFWMSTAMWWAFKSPTGAKALTASSLPWVACAVLSLPLGGVAMGLAMVFYAQLCAWSVLCAGVHFLGEPWNVAQTKQAWVASLSKLYSLALFFFAAGLFAMVWAKLCADATGLAPFLEELKTAGNAEKAREIVGLYWDKDGLDGLAWGIGLQQIGLAIANGFWCLLPWRAIDKQAEGFKALGTFGLACFSRAPLALLGLGFVGSLLAQFSLIFPPLGFLSGVWFSACAFAYRDLRGADQPGC